MFKSNRYLYLVIGIVAVLSMVFFIGCTSSQAPAPAQPASTTTTPATISGLSWTFVDGNGQNGINTGSISNFGGPQLMVFNSKLYATWEEFNNSNKYAQIRVAVFNGNDSSPVWTFVDNSPYGINFDKDRHANYPQLTVFNSKLYAIWSEDTADNRNLIRVAVYNGNDSSPDWASLSGLNGINKDSTAAVYDPQLTVNNSKLYAIWQERNKVTNILQNRVAVYNGNDSSPSWTFVDGLNGINKDPNENAYEPQLTAFNSKLYATWHEFTGTTKTQIRVAVYNGNDSNPVWTFVDGDPTYGLNGVRGQGAGFPQLTVYNSKLYAIWGQSLGNTPEARVEVYNGNDSSPVWTFAGRINSNGGEYQLTVCNSKLYAIGRDYVGSKFRIRVAEYNGNDSSPTWTFVDNNVTNCINKDPSQTTWYPQLTAFNSKLYATWHEDNSGGLGNFQVRVAVGQ